MTTKIKLIFITALLLLGVGIASAVLDDFNTVALLHLDDANGTQTYADLGHINWTHGVGTLAYLNTTNPKFGISSLNTSRTRTPTGDYIFMYPAGREYWVGENNGDYTIEAWVRPEINPISIPYSDVMTIISNYEPVYTTGWTLYIQNLTTPGSPLWYLLFDVYQNASLMTRVVYYTNSASGLTTLIPPNQWSHVAVIQKNAIMAIYINGGIGQNANWWVAYTYPGSGTATILGLNTAATYGWSGKIDEVRVSRYNARYIGSGHANFTAPSAAFSYPYWAYTTPGAYGWVCPAGVTRVMVKIIGGGEGGWGSSNTGGSWAGWGGLSGRYVNITNFDVTPGVSYPITVGTGGTGGVFYYCGGVLPQPGTFSSGFNQFASGGQRDNSTCQATTTLHPGVNGLQGGQFATSGGGGGGIYGWGHGAGGGGAAAGSSGGNGANGAVIIAPWGFDKNYNYPNFSAPIQTTMPGTALSFNDTSIIYNTTGGLHYHWDFGDGSDISHVIGNTTHVYAFAGSFTVNLSISNGGQGEMYESKNNYITVITSQATTYMVPHTVTMTLTDSNNNPLEGVSISAAPQNFTAPDGWLNTYYGVAPGVILNGTTLNGVTGYDGGWSAPMLGAYRYNFTFYKAGVVANRSFSTFPVKDEYNLKIPLVGQTFQPAPASSYISYYLYNNTVNSTAENFTIKYKDTSGGTGTIIYNITNSSGLYKANGTIAVGGGTGWNNVTTVNVSHSAGESLTVRFSAPQTQVGYVNKSYTVTWDNLKTLGGYPDWVSEWIGIAALVLFAGSISLVSVKYAVIILPILAGFMVIYTRWLTPAIGVTAFIASCGILFTLGVLRYIRDQKGKLGRT